MTSLKIADFEVVESAPDNWIHVPENAWGYLTLLALQDAGQRDCIARVRRGDPVSEYRKIVDEDTESYVEEAGAAYHQAFLDWLWFFKLPASQVHPWGAVNQVLAESVRAPKPPDVRVAMQRCIKQLYS